VQSQLRCSRNCLSIQSLGLMFEAQATGMDRITGQDLPDDGGAAGLAAPWDHFSLTSSRCKPAREGPNARIVCNEESAVVSALKRGFKGPGCTIFYPYEGTIFNSCEEAREFYNLYSWEVGFGIRYGRSNKNNKGYTTRQDIVCSCEVCR